MPQFHEQVMGVYFDDLDPLSILHNARYLLLFERTLGAFWEELGLGALQDRQEHMHVVRTNEIEYLRPVRGTGQVRVRVWVQNIGRTSMTFGFRVMPINEDVDHARGTRTVVRVDPQTLKAREWTDAFKEHVSPFVVKS